MRKSVSSAGKQKVSIVSLRTPQAVESAGKHATGAKRGNHATGAKRGKRGKGKNNEKQICSCDLKTKMGSFSVAENNKS